MYLLEKEVNIDTIKDELDEHLEAINGNTAEVSAVQEYVSEIDYKVAKLTERIDALQSLLLSQTPSPKLTVRETEVMRVLVSAQEPISSVIIGKNIGLTQDLVAQTLYCLKQKNVPILAQVIDDITYYVIEEHYRDLQKKSIQN